MISLWKQYRIFTLCPVCFPHLPDQWHPNIITVIFSCLSALPVVPVSIFHDLFWLPLQKYRYATVSLSKKSDKCWLHLKSDTLILISDSQETGWIMYYSTSVKQTSQNSFYKVPNLCAGISKLPVSLLCTLSIFKALLPATWFEKVEKSHNWNKPEKWPNWQNKYKSCSDAHNGLKINKTGTIISNLQNQKLRVSWVKSPNATDDKQGSDRFTISRTNSPQRKLEHDIDTLKG